MRPDELPVMVLGTPGAVRKFRRRRMVEVGDVWAIFGALAAAVGVLLGVGWLRRFLSALGPD